MRNVKIEVEESKLTQEVIVKIDGAFAMIDNIDDELSIKAWLSYDSADKLAFQLSSLLQEIERRKDLKDGKSGGELRELTPLEKERVE